MRKTLAVLTVVGALFSSLVLLGAAGPRGDEPPAPFLVVSGSGAASRAPDMAVLSMGASFLEPNAADAQAKVNTAIKAAIAAIETLGVPRKSIRTTGLSLDTVYEDRRRPMTESDSPSLLKLLGYSADMSLRIQLDDVSLAGQIIDAAIKAGVNDLDGVWFRLQDDTPEREIALDRAVAAARRKAQAIAKAMNIELDGVLEIVESHTGGGSSPFQNDQDSGSTVIEPGEITVAAEVEIRYRISQRSR